MFISGKYRSKIGKGGYVSILKHKNYYKEFSKTFKFSSSLTVQQNGILDSLEKLKKKSKVNIYSTFDMSLNGVFMNSSKENECFRSKMKDYTNNHEISFLKIEKLNTSIDFEICEKRLLELLQ